MKENDYRDLVIEFDKLAKKVGEKIPDGFDADKSQIFYHIRYACHLLRDIRAIMDMRENPNKVFAEFTPKSTGVTSKPELKDVTN